MDFWQTVAVGLALLFFVLYLRERSRRGASPRGRSIERPVPRPAAAPATSSPPPSAPHKPAGGLLGHAEFEATLEATVRRVDGDGSALSLLIVALDDLDLVRDGFGESVRSGVLQQALARLHAAAGAGTHIGLGAGGEFLLLLSGSAAVSMPLARRLMAALDEPYALEGHQPRCTSSIGVAVYPQHGPRAALMEHLTLALRHAREQGGAQVCLYDPELAAHARNEALLVHDLHQAAALGQLALYFQPKMHARSMQVTAAEALLRWHHPTRGLISPTVFIPLAEKYRLMEGIGRWVIEEACRNAAVWLRCGLRMRVAVNISVSQMHQEDLVEHILATLAQNGLEPERFTCEITESVAMADTEGTRRTFEQMRQAGLHVSIDDFGTGYSSLALLRRLPAAELKIDRAFVMDLEESEDARSIAKSIIDMARALGLHVVAEGVETPGQSRILVELGCDELQGFLFSMPISAAELQAMAGNRSAATGTEFRNSLFATDFSSDPGAL